MSGVLEKWEKVERETLILILLLLHDGLGVEVGRRADDVSLDLNIEFNKNRFALILRLFS